MQGMATHAVQAYPQTFGFPTLGQVDGWANTGCGRLLIAV